ncbi:hypothetical protein [Thalassotalea sp. PP2-459]|uniref:hypothetical protein n=1 Tax=Thalassotalea sp. PP2-459 TaxID=1742724 RepID=UPI000942457D|nr:hypothetical protein [Thalassotalea sp. PP2-459]OKY27757.1 hypothetical protein BI291_07525 [Thalassotalea sp. PP2-459]
MYFNTPGLTALEKEENVIDQVLLHNMLDGELVADITLALISVKSQLLLALGDLQSNYGITTAGKAAISNEIYKLNAFITKLNVYTTMLNGGGQIAHHIYNDEMALALSESTGLLIALGITITAGPSITGALITLPVLVTLEWGTDYIANELASMYNTAMYEGHYRDNETWEWHSCRFEKYSIRCEAFIPPIIIDMKNNGLELLALKNSQVFIDIDTDQIAERVAWFDKSEAVLLYDVNGSGTFDNIKEISLSWLTSKSGASDLEGLMMLDSNKDNQISYQDEEYNQLYLWKDNGDGISTHDEMISLASIDAHLGLTPKNISKMVEGNFIAASFSLFISDQKYTAYDVFLRTKFEEKY